MKIEYRDREFILDYEYIEQAINDGTSHETMKGLKAIYLNGVNVTKRILKFSPNTFLKLNELLNSSY